MSKPSDVKYMEKTLPSGETITIAQGDDGWDVDCWKANGDNHWSRSYREYAPALREYERWN